jgi:hypothetical protein
MIWDSINDVDKILDFIDKVCPMACKIDGYDDNIVGLHLSLNSGSHIVYSQYGIILDMMSKGITYYEALNKFAEDIVPQTSLMSTDYKPFFVNDLPDPNLN